MSQKDHDGKPSRLKWTLAGAGEEEIVIPQVDPLAKKREYAKVFRLPVIREVGAEESCVCYSWQYGEAPWIQAFLPSLRKWAKRHRIELKVDAQEAIQKGLRESPYRQWIQHFLAGEFDWMMHVDADVMIHPLAPHVLHQKRESGLWAHEQAFPAGRFAAWRKWVKTSYQREIPDDFPYANDGVWLLDRETAAQLLPLTEGFIAPNVPHEYYFNWWRFLLSEQQAERVKSLEVDWNRLPIASQKFQPAWFYHCAGRDKGAVLKDLQINGFLPVPRPPMTFQPWPEKAEMEKLISLPYRADIDIWKGELLRYALRSLDQYGPADWPLIIWGPERPEWLDESVFRYEDMLQRTLLRAYALAEKVLFMNDDIFFLRPSGEADIAEPLYLEGNLIDDIPSLMQSDNKWQRARGVIASRLHHELGVDRLPDFSTHTPYLFHRKQARKAFEFFGLWFKIPQELAFYGLQEIEGKPCTEKAEMDTLDDPLMRWFNVPDEEVDNLEFRAWMERKFPKPSRWEKPSPPKSE
jgi:hypothetical protein